jgi:ABC-type proline/glycine betaine transport system permease subunit
MHALMLGVRVGLAIGIVTAAANAVMPFIEWLSETIPERRLGVLGVVLILIGFTLQSVQYWLTLLDVPVN